MAFGSHLSKGYLENISSNSGGDLYWIYNEDEFQQLFDNLFEDVFLSYDLEFSPCMFGSEITIELKVKGIDDSLEFAKKLIIDTNVGVAPGIAFGESGEGHLRICFAAKQSFINEIMDRLEPALN